MSKTIVVTGGTSGIGEVAAVELARQGARIVLIARDPERAGTTLSKLRNANPGAQHTSHLADPVADFGDATHGKGDRPKRTGDRCPHQQCGGAVQYPQGTEDGLEMTFATNHMAYFVVTNLLLPNLKPGARVVSTASDAHKGARLDFDDLQSAKKYSGFSVYGRSKLANILFNRELARRIAGTGVTANCLHPGFVATRFGDQSGGILSVAVKIAKPIGAISPEEGAKTIIYLASSPEVEGKSGGYYYKNKLATTDDGSAERRRCEAAVGSFGETRRNGGLSYVRGRVIFRRPPGDFVLPFDLPAAGLRGRIVRLDATSARALSAHALPEPASRVLGETLALAAVLGTALKLDGRLTVQTKSNGALDLVTADYLRRAGRQAQGRAWICAAERREVRGAQGPRQILCNSLELDRLQSPSSRARVIRPIKASSRFHPMELGPLRKPISVSRSNCRRAIRLAAAPLFEAGKTAPSWRAGGIMLQVTPDAQRSDDDWERLSMFLKTVEPIELVDTSLPAETLLWRLFHEDETRVLPAESRSHSVAIATARASRPS